MCAMHWQRQKRTGTTDLLVRPRQTPRRRYATEADRFWAHVQKGDGCWLWKGTPLDTYGQFWSDDGIRHYAHRYSYTLAYGPIPDGMHVDHVRSRGCTSKACVRPDHLEAVPRRTNILRGDGFSGLNARKTECSKGHPYDEANTVWENGWRRCLTCRREKNRERSRQRRQQRQP